MHSPVLFLENKVPRDVLNIIQKYLVNDYVYEALARYFDYLFLKKTLFIGFNYVPEDFRLCIKDNPQFRKIYIDK